MNKGLNNIGLFLAKSVVNKFRDGSDPTLNKPIYDYTAAYK